MDYDLLIVGGGMVGASLACALTGHGLRVGLVEAQPFADTSHPGYDDRPLALAFGSRRIFEGLNLWQAIAGKATPIVRIHVSDRGQPGLVRLEARDEGVEALGYVATARDIGAALAARLTELDDVTLLCPADLQRVSIEPEAARATLEVGGGDTLELTARLLIAADGAHSRVRRDLGIEAIRWDYRQTAVIANTTPELPHGNVAFERFTDAGPLALLPMSEGRCAVVCTVAEQHRDAVLGLDDGGFLALLQDRFGDRLGRFQRIGARQGYPLFMMKSREHARHRVAVIGNAAHTLHPVAGQGFNLGLRDVAALAEVIVDAHRAGDDLGTPALLKRYADWRRWDQRGAIAFTDGLARLFSNPLGPVRLVRNLGLLALDLLPPAKSLLSRHTMGLEGRLPRLARGLPLTVRRTV
jgi:2-octaprenyl-6-methoxyphenol hydroxylase